MPSSDARIEGFECGSTSFSDLYMFIDVLHRSSGQFVDGVCSSVPPSTHSEFTLQNVCSLLFVPLGGIGGHPYMSSINKTRIAYGLRKANFPGKLDGAWSRFFHQGLSMQGSGCGCLQRFP